MNVIILDGRLVKDIELKVTQSNKQIASFTIASQRDKEHSDFIECVAFDNNAKFISEHFKKGDGINIQGSLRQTLYETKDGKKVSSTNVLVNNVFFPIRPKKEKTDNTNTVWESAKNMQLEPDDLPFY